MSNPCYKFLHTEKVSQMARSGAAVHVLREGDSLEKAVAQLAQWRVQSAPVLDASGKVVSNLDVLDIVSFICTVAPSPWQLEHQFLASLETAGRAISLELVKNVVNASGSDALVPLYEESPATEALNLLGQGLHRVAVCDREGNVTSIVSQMDLVALLASHLHIGDCKIMAAKTLTELGLGAVAPICVSETDTVLTALRTIKENRISAVAVVNAAGKLAANFSASDLVGLYRESYPDFLLTVGAYLAKHSHRSLVPLTAHASNSFRDVVKELVASHVHRVWLVDGDHKPTGVVSLTDVMKVTRDWVL